MASLAKSRGTGAMVMSRKARIGLPCRNASIQPRKSGISGDTTFAQLRMGQSVDYEIGRDERPDTPKATQVRIVE